jgi:hypothetical protein
MAKINLGAKATSGLILGLGILGGVLFYGGFFNGRKTVIEGGKNAENIEAEPLLQKAQDIGEKQAITEGENADPSQDPIDADVPEKNEKASLKKNIAGNELHIINRLVNFGFEARSARKIDTIIIHSSYDAIGSDPFSVGGVIAEYREYGVAPHFLIDREGAIYRLVPDKDVAYHAGAGEVPDGRSGVNEFSLGIELLNTKTAKFTDKQYGALNDLLVRLKTEYGIKYVLGHDQIAPGRKNDPWNFEWNRIK